MLREWLSNLFGPSEIQQALDALESRNAELEGQISGLQGANVALNRQAHDKEQYIKQTERELTAVRQERDRAETSNVGYNNEIVDLKSRIVNLEEESANSRSHAQAAYEERDEARATLARSEQDLVTALDERDKARAGADKRQQRIAAVERENRQLRQANGFAQQELHKVQQQLAEAQKDATPYTHRDPKTGRFLPRDQQRK